MNCRDLAENGQGNTEASPSADKVGGKGTCRLQASIRTVQPAGGVRSGNRLS